MKLVDLPPLIRVAWGQNASGPYIRTVPVDSQIGVQDGAASFATGFVPDNMTPLNAGGVPPFGQDMNGLGFQITNPLRWLQAGGPRYYDAVFSAANGGYPKYAILNQVGATAAWWISTVDDNTSNPDTGGANWIAFPTNVVAARTVTAGGAFTIGVNDSYIGLKRTTSMGPSSAALPTSVNGKQFTITDLRGDFSVYPCTVSPSAGTQIAGLSSFVMKADRMTTKYTFFADSSQWSAE